MSATSYYQAGAERADRVRRLFNKIARRYDLINDLQSAGMHRLWKRRLISSLLIRPNDRVLDLACGSGDLAYRVLQKQPNARVVGGDFTFSMLKMARAREQSIERRASSVELSSSPSWFNLDALAMPFAPETFDAVMMAYGLRNMADPLHALQEIARVLKLGGIVAILDFGRPSNPIIRFIYHLLLKTIQPALGWIFFRDSETYRYIYESLQRYPAQEGVTCLLNEAGFTQITCHNMALGAMSLHVARKKI